MLGSLHMCLWPPVSLRMGRPSFRSIIAVPNSSNLVSPPRTSSAHLICTTAPRSTTAASLLDSLVNHERSGIPPLAGTSSSSRFDLGRMHRLLTALGNPHLALKAVHVAGSKGKGSTATLLAHVFAAAGCRPGLYTSPHLLALEERIAVGAHPGADRPRPRPIPADDLAFLLAHHGAAIRARAAAEGGELSHFEVMTSLALRYFADCGVDVAVVETGLGGVMDATNVFPPDNLQVAVITGLGLEHVEALGGSLASIGRAKAGITRPGRPLVLGRQVHGDAEGAVLAEAAARGCSRVVRAEQSVSVRSHGMDVEPGRFVQAVRERLTLQLLPEPDEERGSSSISSSSSIDGGGGYSRTLDVSVGLVGPHQHDNVATAVATLRLLRRQGWRLPDAAVAAGLAETHLPGRFQVVKLPGQDGPWVVLDGAHTADSAAALVASLRAAFPDHPPAAAPAIPGSRATSSTALPAARPVPVPVALVLAMAADKDHRGVVAALRGLQPRVAVFTSVPIAGSYTRASAPGTLAGHWQAAAILAPPSQRPFRCRELVQASLGAAVDKARQELVGVRAGMGLAPGVGPPGVVLVTGSLHAVAEAHKLPELAPLLLPQQLSLWASG